MENPDSSVPDPTQDARRSNFQQQEEIAGRPRISKYGNGGKFRVNDKVMLSEPGVRAMQGPLLVASMPQAGKYTLSNPDGTKWSNGKIVDESQLDLTT